jgi:hypothetical protein
MRRRAPGHTWWIDVVVMVAAVMLALLLVEFLQ